MLKPITLVLIASFIITSCAPGVPPEIEALCQSNGGVKIHKKARNVRGVYYGGPLHEGKLVTTGGCLQRCQNFLTERAYDFVEVGRSDKAFDITKDDFKENFLHQTFYRYSLQKAGSPLCKDYTWVSDGDYRLRVAGRDGSFPIGSSVALRFGNTPMCIGIEKIEKPTSKYAYFNTIYFFKQTITREIPITGIQFSREFITNTETGEVLAEANYYGNRYYPFYSALSSLDSDSAWCPARPILLPINEVLLKPVSG